MDDNKEAENLREEVRALKKELSDYKQIVKELSAPVIPSIIPKTILVPITGKLSQERFELIISTLLETCYEKSIETVIIDFTAISKHEAGESSMLGKSIDNLVSSLKLMGSETFLVGFTPSLIQELMKSGLAFSQELHTFLTFRSALQYLMKKKGISFV